MLWCSGALGGMEGVAGLMRWIAKIIGAANAGRLDYWLEPALRESFGGPFNGQERRKEIFRDLLRTLPIEAIVETGTYRGTTSLFLARESRLPVHTVEANARSHAFARLQLRAFIRTGQLQPYLGDSRRFLARLARERRLPDANVFFYLDAHWSRDLPLREELELIFRHWRDAVVMVDDFQVPGTDYEYDDYGEAGVLALPYLAPLSHLELDVFFPAAAPESETGGRRGCVVICRDPRVSVALEEIESLDRRLAARKAMGTHGLCQ